MGQTFLQTARYRLLCCVVSLNLALIFERSQVVVNFGALLLLLFRLLVRKCCLWIMWVG